MKKYNEKTISLDSPELVKASVLGDGLFVLAKYGKDEVKVGPVLTKVEWMGIKFPIDDNGAVPKRGFLVVDPREWADLKVGKLDTVTIEGVATKKSEVYADGKLVYVNMHLVAGEVTVSKKADEKFQKWNKLVANVEFGKPSAREKAEEVGDDE